MAEYLNIVDKIVSLTKNEAEYIDGELVDSPLRMSYSFKKHPEDGTKYFLTVEWNYRHRYSEKSEVLFSIEVMTAYQVDFKNTQTTFDNVYEVILDSHKRLKTHYEKAVADTSFANLELTDPDEDDLNRKAKKIVYEDIPELNLQ